MSAPVPSQPGISRTSSPLTHMSSDASGAPPTTPPPPSASYPLPGLKNTPYQIKSSATQPFTTMHYYRSGRIREKAREMMNKWVGPMPVDEFMKEFMPEPPSNDVFKFTRSSAAALDQVAQKKVEEEMYVPLIKALQRFCHADFEFVDTHATPDLVFEAMIHQKLKPDIGFYANGRRTQTTDFANGEMFLELKVHEADDPFSDRDTGDFERDSDKARDTAGQIASYAIAQFASQFRTHLFSVLIVKRTVRLIYWDRAGAVVTEGFRLDDEHLAKFFWRYSRSSEQVRGIDQTVDTSPSPAEIALATQNGRLVADPKKPFVKFTVLSDKPGEDPAYYIGHSPVFKRNSSLTGRATRTFAVWDLQKNIVDFMKDTWRIDIQEIMKEGDVYAQLEEAKVPNIAPFVRAGDLGHRTRVQSFTSQPWCRRAEKAPPLRPHQHYRLVLGVVARDLTSFASTRELVTAMKDALIAHKFIYERVKILHRDISVGNILITREGTGLLIDFDLCKKIKDLQARQSERSGTWQFMSAKLQQTTEDLTPTIADDLESFLHVLNWVVMRCVPLAWAPAKLTNHFEQVFDYHEPGPEGRIIGGEQKVDFLRTKTLLKSGFKNPPLRILLKSLSETFGARYIFEGVDDDPNPEVLARMDNSDWMIEQFKKAITTGPWELDDKPQENAILEKKEGAPMTKSAYPEMQSSYYEAIPSAESAEWPPIAGDGKRRRLNRAPEESAEAPAAPVGTRRSGRVRKPTNK